MAEDTQTTKPERQATTLDNPGPVDEIFVDGIAGGMTRGRVVKFDLYRVVRVDSEPRVEHRQVSRRLVLPQAALPELAHLLQEVVDALKKQRAQAVPQDTAGAEVESILESDFLE